MLAGASQAVGDFSRVDPKGKTDRQLLIANLKQSEAVHACLEEHRTIFNQFVGQTQLAALQSTEKRQELQGDLLDLKSIVVDQGGSIKTLTLALGVEKPAEGETKPHGSSIATWPLWKVLTTLGGMFSILLVLFQISVKVAPVIFAYLMSLSP